MRCGWRRRSSTGCMTAGSGSSRRPAFRVLAMTPTIVTSGARVVSIERPRRRTARARRAAPARRSGSRRPARASAAASLITATRSPRRTSAASNMRPPRSGMPNVAQVIGAGQVERDRASTRRRSGRRFGTATAGRRTAGRTSPPRRPGSARDALEQLLREAVALVERRVLRRRQRHAHDQHARPA